MSSSSILRWYLYSPPLKNQSLFKSFRHCMNWMFLYFRANKLIRIKVWEQEKPLLWPFYTHSNCAASSSSIWSSRSILCKGLWLLNDSDGNWKTNLFTILLLMVTLKNLFCVDQNVENVHCFTNICMIESKWNFDHHRVIMKSLPC